MSKLEDVLKKLDPAEVAKEVEAMRADVADRTAKLQQAERLLKLLTGEPLRKPRKPRAAKGTSPATPAPPQVDDKSELNQVVSCLREAGKPLSPAAIARQIDLTTRNIESILQANPTVFRSVTGGSFALVR